jgi:hypothetical protein
MTQHDFSLSDYAPTIIERDFLSLLNVLIFVTAEIDVYSVVIYRCGLNDMAFEVGIVYVDARVHRGHAQQKAVILGYSIIIYANLGEDGVIVLQ